MENMRRPKVEDVPRSRRDDVASAIGNGTPPAFWNHRNMVIVIRQLENGTDIYIYTNAMEAV